MFNFLIYSSFNLVPNPLPSLLPFYLSARPPLASMVSSVQSLRVLSLYSSIHLPFWRSLSSLKVVTWGYFILTFFYVGHNTPSIHLSSCESAFVTGLFRLVYNCPSLSSPTVFHSFIITPDQASLMQPFHHLHHPSSVSGCLCVSCSLPGCFLTVLAEFFYFFFFFSPSLSLQLFTQFYLRWKESFPQVEFICPWVCLWLLKRSCHK